MSNYQKPIVIKANGTISPFTFSGNAPGIEDMQKAVEGYFEYIYLRGKPSRVMVINEEGLLHQLPLNKKASILAGRNIVGNVIVMPQELLQ